jgi:hypothetical protein
MKYSSLSVTALALLFLLSTANAQEVKSDKQTETDTAVPASTKKSKTKKVKPASETVKQAPVSETKDTTSQQQQPGKGESEAQPVKDVPGRGNMHDIRGTKQFITQKENGSINWTQQFITAKGSSVLDTVRFKNAAQARMMATRGAMVVAQRNLLEIIKGVEVTSETTVQDMVATNDFVYTRVDGIVKGAQQLGEPIVKDGMVEITMRVPLYETNGLAPALYDNIPASPKNVKQAAGREAPGSTDTASTSLDKIALNFNGKEINPSMFPVIVDENNNLVLDMSKLYDPKKGKFPKILQASREILNEAGYKNAVKVIDVIDSKDGKIVIDNASVKKINWAKIGKTAGTIGKFLLMLI